MVSESFSRGLNEGTFPVLKPLPHAGLWIQEGNAGLN